MNLNKIFEAGDVISGYCNGFFGRDDYSEKTCVLVTKKYAVFEYENGNAVILNADQHFSKENVKEWKAEAEVE